MSAPATTAPTTATGEKSLYNKRNFWCFALGTFGRDFAYNLFVNNLLTFILFTKTLTNLQFSFVSAIIIAARVFDAFNDPVMGGIVENTRSRFGKFRPWILIGGATTSLIIVLLFSVPVDNWAFIGFLAVMYLTFSVTFTMNDISYWALLPHLARGTHERNKLSSVTQLVVSAGGGLAAVSVPALTTTYSRFLGGSARSAYMWISIICAFLFVASTLVTFFGVQDHTEVMKNKSDGAAAVNDEKLSLKDMFRVLKNNDQLLIAAVIMVIYNVGATGITGALIPTYIYFAYGYNGLLATVFSTVGAVMTILFTATFPYIMKKMGRTRLINLGGFLIIGGYALVLLLGLTVPNGEALFEVLGMKFNLRYLLMMIPYGVACLGQSCYYNLMFLNISNTVEYNEWKTGKREESLIFSLRPFTAKLSSALQQLLVTVVYIVVGVLAVTNGISDLDKLASQGTITNAEMLTRVNELLASVPESKTNALLCCMCIIPIVFMAGAMFLYKKKFILDDATYERIKAEIAARNSVNASEETAEPETGLLFAEAAADETAAPEDEPLFAEAEADETTD
ncbi:MAG: glycoside-pentoside-hexuronide (GPH):cation symporter [Christensenellales bacterium]